MPKAGVSPILQFLHSLGPCVGRQKITQEVPRLVERVTLFVFQADTATPASSSGVNNLRNK